MTMKAGEAARTGAKSRSGGGARNVFILIMVSKILAAAAPPLPLGGPIADAARTRALTTVINNINSNNNGK